MSTLDIVITLFNLVLFTSSGYLFGNVRGYKSCNKTWIRSLADIGVEVNCPSESPDPREMDIRTGNLTPDGRPMADVYGTPSLWRKNR